MLRSVSRGLIRQRRNFSVNNANKSSSGAPGSGPGGGGGKAALIGSAVTVTGLGGTVAYASFDPDFRKTVESSVPGSGNVLNMILGEPEAPEQQPEKKKKPAVPVTSAPPSKKRPISIPEPVNNKPKEVKDESEDDKKGKEISPSISSSTSSTMAILPSPPLEKPSFLSEDKKPEKKVDEPKKPKSEPEAEKPAAPKAAEDKKPAKKDEESPKLELPTSTTTTSEGDEDPEEISVGKDLHKKVLEMREELEAQMIAQLKRQSEAHADHINDALAVQKKELNRENARKTDEEVEKVALAYKEELSMLIGHLKGNGAH